MSDQFPISNTLDPPEDPKFTNFDASIGYLPALVWPRCPPVDPNDPFEEPRYYTATDYLPPPSPKPGPEYTPYDSMPMPRYLIQRSWPKSPYPDEAYKDPSLNFILLHRVERFRRRVRETRKRIQMLGNEKMEASHGVNMGKDQRCGEAADNSEMGTTKRKPWTKRKEKQLQNLKEVTLKKAVEKWREERSYVRLEYGGEGCGWDALTYGEWNGEDIDPEELREEGLGMV